MKRAATHPPIDITEEQWRIVRTILERHIPGIEVWAFGSRARRTSSPYSDLDLAIIGRGPHDQRIVGAMQEDFVESNLPWKVDVLDWAMTSEAFQKVISSHCVVLMPLGSGSQL